MLVYSHVILCSFLLTFSQISTANEEEKALEAIGKASYKQFDMDDKVEELKDKYISKEVQKYGGWAFQIGKVIHEKKITYKWRF